MGPKKQDIFPKINILQTRLNVAILKWPIPLADSAELAIVLEQSAIFLKESAAEFQNCSTGPF